MSINLMCLSQDNLKQGHLAFSIYKILFGEKTRFQFVVDSDGR